MIGERGDLELLGTTDRFELEQETDARPWLGLLAGLAGGFLATMAMDGFHGLSKLVTTPLHGKERSNEGSDGGDEAEEPSTVKLARRISGRWLHRDLDDPSAEVMSSALHYAYGTLMGGVYGMLAELYPKTAMGAGAPYGTLLFALGDEIAVPALGLAKKPSEYPVATHVRALGAHLVYGTTLDLTRRGIRSCVSELEAHRAEERGVDRDRDRAVLWIERTEIDTDSW